VSALLLKLVITPTLVAFATLLGRRFGQSFAGWLVGFPFTSGPISLFLAIEHGTDFAAAAAVGSIASVIAQGVFALVYARTARRGVIVALFAATFVFAVTGAASSLVAAIPTVVLVVAWLVLVLVARLMPARARTEVVPPPPPRWDLPARMVAATAVVLAITALAPSLGAFPSGVLSGFPLYATVLGIFAQRVVGPGAAVEVMRGLGAGLFAFAAFFFVIATTLVTLGVGTAFALAVAAILAVQAVSFAWLRRSGE